MMRVLFVTLISVLLLGSVDASRQCFTHPSPSGRDFLRVSLETTSSQVRCTYTLFAPYNTRDSISMANPTVILQLFQSSVEFCCASAAPADYTLITSNLPYRLVTPGVFSSNASLFVDVQLPVNAYLAVRNEADFQFVLASREPTTLTVSNTSLSTSCGVTNPYLSILGAVGGGSLLGIPFDGQMNVSAQDQGFTVTVVPVRADCTAPIKLSITSATFVAPPSSCLTIQAYSNTSCALPCSDRAAFVCMPGLQAFLTVYTPRYSNVSVTVNPTAIYPIQCFANNKQVAGEGAESGWFTAQANTNTTIACSTVGAIQYQPPYPTFEIFTKRIPFTPTFNKMNMI